MTGGSIILMHCAFNFTKDSSIKFLILEYSANYYKQCIDEIESLETSTKSHFNRTNSETTGNLVNASEIVTLRRVQADANLRYAVCHLKLYTDNIDTKNASERTITLMEDSCKHLEVAIQVYKGLGKSLDLVYSQIWLLRAKFLISVTSNEEPIHREIDKLVSEAEQVLTSSTSSSSFTDRDWKNKQKLTTELGYIVGQLSHDRAETLLATNMDEYNSVINKVTSDNEKYTVDKQWLYTHKARAATGLSEYEFFKKFYDRKSLKDQNNFFKFYHHHTKGNKKGAFKILLSAAKDYGRAGNEKQRAKCLVLAVDNYVHLLSHIERKKKRETKANVLLSI